jgi:hypothetical protein
MPGMILGDAVMLCWLYLVTKPSHMGVDVDGLTCPLHHPTVCSRQMKGWSFLLGVALSHHVAAGSGTFSGGARPPGQNI